MMNADVEPVSRRHRRCTTGVRIFFDTDSLSPRFSEIFRDSRFSGDQLAPDGLCELTSNFNIKPIIDDWLITNGYGSNPVILRLFLLKISAKLYLSEISFRTQLEPSTDEIRREIARKDLGT